MYRTLTTDGKKSAKYQKSWRFWGKNNTFDGSLINGLADGILVTALKAQLRLYLRHTKQHWPGGLYFFIQVDTSRQAGIFLQTENVPTHVRTHWHWRQIPSFVSILNMAPMFTLIPNWFVQPEMKWNDVIFLRIKFKYMQDMKIVYRKNKFLCDRFLKYLI